MARAISQEALANAAGLDRKYFGRVERGESVPSLITLFKLAAALGVPLSRLLERAERVLERTASLGKGARLNCLKDSGQSHT